MASVKRVLILAHLFPRQSYPDYGVHVYNVSVRLGIDVLVITRRQADALWPVDPQIQIHEIAYPHIGLQRLPPGIIPRLFGFAQVGIGQVILAARAVSPARAYRPDIVHSFGALTLPAALAIRVFTGASVVVTLEGTDFQRIRKSSLLTRWLGLADAVICVSGDMYSELKRKLPHKAIYQCPAGVDLSAFAFRSASERQPRLISVGRFAPVKRYDRLLEAVAIVFEQRSDLSLLIMGRGSLLEPLEELANALGIQDRVEFGGVVDKQELATLLSTSQLFVMSSDWEGTPKALLEALACGTPAVVTDVGACAELVRGAGVVSKSQEPQDIAEAILQVLATDDGSKLSKQAVSNAAPYSWDRIVERVKSIYEEVYERRHGSVNS